MKRYAPEINKIIERVKANYPNLMDLPNKEREEIYIRAADNMVETGEVSPDSAEFLKSAMAWMDGVASKLSAIRSVKDHVVSGAKSVSLRDAAIGASAALLITAILRSLTK